jgi:exonuclease III
MRIVTWNLAYMTPGTYKGAAIREQQWRFLLSLNADVMLLQECRPDDLRKVEDADARHVVVGSIPPRWIACSVVVAKEELSPLPLPRPGTLFECLSGYVALATVETPIGRLAVCSVHTPARELLDPPLLSEQDHRQLRRVGAERAWYNDVAFAALDALPREAGFIFGGDWNVARLFDSNYPIGAEGGASATEFFRRAAERGWSETLRTFYPEEVRTYLKAGTAPYENDHVFTDAALHRRLTRCEVIETIDGPPVIELSDHAPIMAEFELVAT